MTTMVEKVARAIGASLDESDTPWEKCGSGFKEICTDAARAAIEAMMEPTSKMLDAAADEEDRRGYFSHENLIAEEVWPIMIQAALKEGQ